MRVLSWNCGGGFRAKIERALEFEADIVVIQEAHDPKHYVDRVPAGSATYWELAPHAKKGIFIWARPGWKIGLSPGSHESPGFHQILRLVITPPGQEPIDLWGVWTHAAATFAEGYVGQAHGALDAWGHLLGSRSILMGDFNSNAIWDAKRSRNHTLLVERLAERGLRSAYHEHSGDTHGAERVPTQWQIRREDWPFHLDYAFVGAGFAVQDVAIGSYDEWCRRAADGGVSDHAPLLVELEPVGVAAAAHDAAGWTVVPPPLVLTGEEEFNGLDATALDFWRFAAGDLRTNNTRGHLAEFLVSRAVGLSAPARVEWDDHDVVTPGGVTIEVKSSGLLQVWSQKANSVIRFGGLMSRSWDPVSGYSAEPGYKAQVYVFAVHTAATHAAYAPLDVGQWEFYVASRAAVAATGFKQLSLSSVQAIATRVAFAELAEAIALAAKEN